MENRISFEEAKDKALKILEYRTNSEKEMREKLKMKGVEPDIADSVIEFLKEYRFIDDESFALRYASDLKNLKKFGKSRVRIELLKKGISDEFITEATDSLDWEENELYSMVKKKLKGDFDKKSIDRCIRYFAYKGYSFDDIKTEIEKIKAE